MRTVDVKDTFEITGRGTVYCTRMADPPYTVNEHVLIDGRRHVVTAIERYPLMNDAGLAPGKPVGLLCRPMGEI